MVFIMLIFKFVYLLRFICSYCIDIITFVSDKHAKQWIILGSWCMDFKVILKKSTIQLLVSFSFCKQLSFWWWISCLTPHSFCFWVLMHLFKMSLKHSARPTCNLQCAPKRKYQCLISITSTWFYNIADCEYKITELVI